MKQNTNNELFSTNNSRGSGIRHSSHRDQNKSEPKRVEKPKMNSIVVNKPLAVAERVRFCHNLFVGYVMWTVQYYRNTCKAPVRKFPRTFSGAPEQLALVQAVHLPDKRSSRHSHCRLNQHPQLCLPRR